MVKDRFFTFFSNCIPVEGAADACIYDLQYGDIYKVPKQLIPILNEIETIPYKDFSFKFDKETHNILLQYIDFFVEHDIGIWSIHPEWFPPISDKWDYPATISNAILELNSDFSLLLSIIKQLDDFNCKVLEIRVYSFISDEELQMISDSTKNTGIQSVNLYLSSFKKSDSEYWIKLIKSNPRLLLISVFGKEENKRIDLENNYSVSHRVGQLHSNRCGAIDQKMFSVNVPTYTESLHHNSCLNRKISLDTEGNIKSCPSMKESFGNIKDTTLAEAIEKPGFKKYWDINKDKIHVCKDCEFRYICTDCRAYVEDPEDILSKPLKCGYNPYTGEWSEWSTNPLKQKTIDFYGMREMVEKSNSKHSE